MKKIKTRDIIFVAIGVLFLVFVGYSMNFSKDWGKKIADDFYVNAKGQKWTLPTDGAYEFTASSGQYPKFLSGKIDPLKVKVGDTQTMTIRVASPRPIKSVKALIETDTKTQEVELMLKESKALSGNYFRTQPYLVNDKGELVINNTNASYAEKAIEQIVSKAEAQALVEYTYEGTWVANDTHTKTYHTKFIAEGDDGETSEMMLAWSDPVCVFDTKGTLQSDCDFNLGVEGFDGGNITIQRGITLTVNAKDPNTPEGKGYFVWNGDEGKKITVEGIIVLGGGEIIQGGLYYNDDDSDGWPADIEPNLGGGPHNGCTLSNCTRIKNSAIPSGTDLNTLVNGGIDCRDDVYAVNPGAPYHNNPGDNGWDWNCSGSVEGGWLAANLETSPSEVFGHLYIVANSGTGYLSYTFAGEQQCGVISPNVEVQTCDVGKIPQECPLSSFHFQDVENILGGGPIENGWISGTRECVRDTCLGPSVQTYCR